MIGLLTIVVCAIAAAVLTGYMIGMWIAGEIGQ